MSPKKPKRVALYLRVSTSEQTTRNQRRELHAVAERHGWQVVATYEDAGVSGALKGDRHPPHARKPKCALHDLGARRDKMSLC